MLTHKVNLIYFVNNHTVVSAFVSSGTRVPFVFCAQVLVFSHQKKQQKNASII